MFFLVSANKCLLSTSESLVRRENDPSHLGMLSNPGFKSKGWCNPFGGLSSLVHTEQISVAYRHCYLRVMPTEWFFILRIMTRSSSPWEAQRGSGSSLGLYTQVCHLKTLTPSLSPICPSNICQDLGLLKGRACYHKHTHVWYTNGIL